jgi:hypothetical protein
MKSMKHSILATLGLLLAAAVFIGFMAMLDHRIDRNVPGATTGSGRASLIDPAAQ